jgi:miniconductance mechanosensitive channel
MTWDDILIEKKKCLISSRIYIPALLVIFAQCHYFTEVSNIRIISLHQYMIVILLVIIWTIIALLAVFDDILSKSPDVF